MATCITFSKNAYYSPLTVGELFKGCVFTVLDGTPLGDEKPIIRAVQNPPTLILTGECLEMAKADIAAGNTSDWLLGVPIDRVLSPESTTIVSCERVSVSASFVTQITMKDD